MMSLVRGRMSRWAWGLVLLFSVPATAQPPAGYYSSAEGLSGQPLRQALHIIISNHDPLSYAGLWNAFTTTDAKPGNKVWDIYSDNPNGTPPYEYTFGTDQCGNYTGEGDCYNREHSFPQSWFNSGNPMRTDLFHIYPTDGWVNQKRGNLPFGKVGSPDWTSLNGSKVGLSMTPGYNGTVFEPIDAYKGDLARTYFYMMTRYYGEMASWSTPMMADGDLAPWAMAQLMEWHLQDPVSAKETARNNAVFALQHNRNPFIDRPEWVQAIWGAILGMAEQPIPSFGLVTDTDGLTIDMGEHGTSLLTIRDLSGRVVASETVTTTTAHIPFRAANGIYVAELNTPGGRMARRFAW